MRQFLDSKQRAWCIDINVGTVLDVQANTGINLFDPGEIDEQTKLSVSVRLAVDDLYFAQVLALLVSEQVDALGIEPKDFLNALNGDALKNAEEAFFAEYVDFFILRGRNELATNLKSQIREVKNVSTQRQSGKSQEGAE